MDSASIRSTPRLPFILAIGLACGAAQAQERGIEEVSVVGRQLNLIGSATSASEGQISQQELDLRPLLRVGEVLETVPGLVATQHSGSGKANQFFLRGFNLDHGTDFATHVDGMPVNMRSHGHGQGYTDLNFLIPELVGSIEFTKGSYDAASGDFAGAGSAHINVASRSVDTRLSLGGGDFGFRRALLTGSADAAGGTFIYGVEQQDYAGAWDSIDEDVDRKKPVAQAELGHRRVWLRHHLHGLRQHMEFGRPNPRTRRPLRTDKRPRLHRYDGRRRIFALQPIEQLARQQCTWRSSCERLCDRLRHESLLQLQLFYRTRRRSISATR